MLSYRLLSALIILVAVANGQQGGTSNGGHPPATFTSLQLIRGSGDFQTFETSITVTKQEALRLRWSTNQTGATGGTWQVTDSGQGKVVASGEAGPAPAAGQFAQFTIADNTFLFPSPPKLPVSFKVTIVPHDAANKPVGVVSAPVLVTEEQEDPQTSFNFGPDAIFPSVTIVSYKESAGVVPETQLHFAGADIILRVSSNEKATDRVWLAVADANQLMRQTTPQLDIPSLGTHTSQIRKVHLDAILPPAKSQMPEEQQYAEWDRQYKSRCGVDLRAVMDWHGPQAKTPTNAHLATVMGLESSAENGKVSPIAPICGPEALVEISVCPKGICVCLKDVLPNDEAKLKSQIAGGLAQYFPKLDVQAMCTADHKAERFGIWTTPAAEKTEESDRLLELAKRPKILQGEENLAIFFTAGLVQKTTDVVWASQPKVVSALPPQPNEDTTWIFTGDLHLETMSPLDLQEPNTVVNKIHGYADAYVAGIHVTPGFDVTTSDTISIEDGSIGCTSDSKVVVHIPNAAVDPTYHKQNFASVACPFVKPLPTNLSQPNGKKTLVLYDRASVSSTGIAVGAKIDLEHNVSRTPSATVTGKPIVVFDQRDKTASSSYRANASDMRGTLHYSWKITGGSATSGSPAIVTFNAPKPGETRTVTVTIEDEDHLSATASMNVQLQSDPCSAGNTHIPGCPH